MNKLEYNVGCVTRRSIPLWPLLTLLADMFGMAVLKSRSVLEAIETVIWAANEGLIEATGAHDCDLVPWDPDNPEDDLNEQGPVHQLLIEIREKLQGANVAFHTMTCNLHAHPLFRKGGLTNPDKKIRDLAKAKVKRSIRIGALLGAEVFVYWVARDGWIVAIKTNFGMVYLWIAEGLNEARAYIKENDFTNYKYGSIEAKPNEPTGHSYIPTAGHAAGFITSPLIADSAFWMENPELRQHEGMAMLDAVTCVAYLVNVERLGFLHLGNQIMGHEDNDFEPLVGPEGLKETANMFSTLQLLGWRGVVEYDCHMLREDADPDDSAGSMKQFVERCSTGLAISLSLADRLNESVAEISGMTAAGADLHSIIRMCGLDKTEIATKARRA
ncbi:MAG: hypothetical protein WC508_06035 [Patescibacteria group bacterium]